MASVDKAVGFLKLWSASNPWALVAIHPNGGKVGGHVFRQGQEAGMRQWIGERIEKYNLYFSVNDVAATFKQGKAKKSDVAFIRGLHVDIDPYDEDLSKEQPRIRRLLEQFPILPTGIVFSGGGLQGFWKLRKPIVASADNIAKVEELNRRIERLCGAKGTWNIDRIMRLPGTRNLPNEVKRKKGRKPSEARLVSFKPSRLYSLSDFEDLPAIPEIAETWLGPLLVTGERPGRDEPYGSRSEASFAAVAEAKKSGLSFDDARAVLLDPSYAISGHMLDQKDPDRAFERAWGDKRIEGVEPASDEELDETVVELNERFVQSFDGGQHQIMQFTPELADEGPYRFLKPGAFLAMFEGKETIKLGKKSVSVAEYWLSHPQRRMVQSIVFAPGRETPEHYNLWQGWAVEPADDVQAAEWSWSLFAEHLFFNVCAEDWDLYDYYLSWWAHKLQKPDRKIGTALILRGGEGTGKTATAKVFQKIFGPHMLKVNDTGQVLGRFNGHHAALLVLHSEESFWAGDKRMEGKLKDIITSDVQSIEFKGKEPKQMPNYYDLYVTGNPEWIVPASLDARRFAVYELGKGRVRDSKFFDAMRRQMWEGEARGCRAFMRYLLDYEITRNLQDVPVTQALVKQKERSFDAFTSFLLDMAELGEIPGSSALDPARVLTSRLYDSYIEWCDRVKEMHGRKNPMWFGRSLAEWGIIRKQLATGARVYLFPKLPEYRKVFDKRLGNVRIWNDIKVWAHVTDYEGDE